MNEAECNEQFQILSALHAHDAESDGASARRLVLPEVGGAIASAGAAVYRSQPERALFARQSTDVFK